MKKSERSFAKSKITTTIQEQHYLQEILSRHGRNEAEMKKSERSFAKSKITTTIQEQHYLQEILSKRHKAKLVTVCGISRPAAVSFLNCPILA
jgi:hypothetical protein